jgi:lathosterol oxidase
MNDKKPRQIWHYTPQLPLKIAPLFLWPMRPVAILGHLLKSWRPVSTRFLMLAVAIVIWLFATPEVELMQSWSFGWVFAIWLRNLVLVTIVAGGLHLWFYVAEKQGDNFRCDMRPMMKNARVFWFKDQVHDNMFWTLTSGVFFWTAWECTMLWLYANGWLNVVSPIESPIIFTLIVVATPIWAGFYFYWQHRLFHTKRLYKMVHSWHHKNQNTSSWSGLAMHPAEHLVLFSDCLIFLLVPFHPVLFLFLLLHHGMGAPISHVGFEGVETKRGLYPLGDFFHQLHHKFFDCNYGTDETPWDAWFGTFHDGTNDGDVAMKERRRLLATG